MKLLTKIGLVTWLGVAMAYAQSPDVTVGGDASASGSAQVSGQVTATVTLSFPEMLSQSKLLNEQNLKHYRHVKYVQEVARKEKDVIKLNCVNDKLVQLKPQMNIADTARITLENSNDQTDRNAVWLELSTASDNIRRLREEADQCIGEGGISAESQSGFTAPDVPDSPYGDPFEPEVVEPPGYASPYN